MLPGSFTGGDVRELVTYALVNGVRREVESFSSDRDLAGDLPEQVAAGGGVSGGSGTIVWAQLEDVQSREISPWHKPSGWPPSSGDRVVVYVTDGATDFPRFTGAIDKTSGTVGGGIQSTVIDDRDKLNASFTHEALLRHHVPFSEGAAYRSIGLSHWYPLTMALRKAGFYNTPPPVADVAVSVPLQGSVWPEGGTVTLASGGGSTGTIHAGFYSAPWGYAAGAFDATYQPRTSYNGSEPLQITVMVAPDHAANANIYVNYGADHVRLRVHPNRVVYAQLNGVLVAQLGPSSIVGMTAVTLLVKNGVWTLRTDKGYTAMGSQVLPAVVMGTIRVTAENGARIAGIQVGRPLRTSHEFSSLSFTPSMRFVPGNLASTMDMMPRLENRNIADLVDEICKATLTAAWFDESGVLQLVSADTMRNASPAQTITTLDDITELGWEDSLLSVRSRVEVTWKDASISKSLQQRKELFRGSGDSLVSADNVEVFATPDDSTEWLGVDRALTILNTSNWGVYNSRRGSFAGYFYSTNGETATESGLTMTVSTENIGTAGVKINHVAGTYPTDVEATLGTSPTSTALWSYLRNQNLPVIRGYGEGKWIDEVTVSATVGPGYAPELTHDLGFWGHPLFEGGSVAQRLADFIAGMVTAPTPTLSGVGVLYDPRRQLGDVITIQSGILDVTLKALVVGISESHAPGDHSQTLTVRIISVTSTRKITYAEFEAAWSGGNYAAFEAAWAGLNYTNFENDPLRGAPNQ
ncbi:hypothetical protein [Glutamicibacter sp.]|uniref:hypothetical protein n=1 Tax=Glutamicibacter sp. TaxID=1931995 RepID=UPI002B45B606|nr:hypothetical protein [Glutamicibacter sp.]HJX77266.1 hypothetical protein [Glutamicibacter sp.]